MLRYLILFSIFNLPVYAQHLQHLKMDVIVNFEKQSISLINTQYWVNTSALDTLQLRLQAPYTIRQITVDRRATTFKYDTVNQLLNIYIPQKSNRFALKITAEGSPQIAKQPPWDGGFIWTKSGSGKHWLTLACQGEGAALWWPAPSRYDVEPDTVTVSVEYPADLFFKGNGRMIKDRIVENRRITAWQTTYPINTYNISLNIGDYAHWSDTLLLNEKKLSLDFYPLTENLEASKKQFKQSYQMLSCFTEAFDVYPFLNDGYSVVETPYAGMEHQSAVAYGNGYENGYAGKDYSGMNLPFDFILIHESAHEWWGNSVSAKNREDFWLQEAFCTYAEMIYVECVFGYDKALRYINLKKNLVKNEAAILGPGNSGADMYSKGALMIHTLSQFAQSREQWLGILKDFYREHAYSSISTSELTEWFCNRMPGLTKEFFSLYLEFPKPPLLNFTSRSLNESESFSCQIALAESSGSATIPVVFTDNKGDSRKFFIGANPQSIELDGPGWNLNHDLSYFRTE